MLSKQEEFLHSNNISLEDFQKSGIDWNDMCAIYDDYKKTEYQKELEDLGKIIASKIGSGFSGYSIRSRIKDPDHLIGKIIRCRIKDQEKLSEYPTFIVRVIDINNYKTEIHDLIGIRISYNFRNEDQEIYERIKQTEFYRTVHEQKFHHSSTESSESIEYWKSCGFTVQLNPKTGYRSHHYIFKHNFGASDSCYFELQTRTVYEDAWGEIDHHLRYPNAMEDPIIMHFSDLLNNISALSVDLCTFMQGVQKKQEEIRVVSVQLAEKEKQIEIASVQLAEKEKQIQKLQKELQNSKVMPHVNYGQIDPDIFRKAMEGITINIPSSLQIAKDSMISLANMTSSYMEPMDIIRVPRIEPSTYTGYGNTGVLYSPGLSFDK